MPTPTRTLLLGLIFLGSSLFAQSDPPKLRKLNNRKHQQHQQRVKATIPSPKAEAEEEELAERPRKTFILRIRRNKNRQLQRSAPTTAADTLDPRESYEQTRRKNRPLKRKK